MVTPDIVRKIADLSRLDLPEEELAQVTNQLSTIFQHFEKLKKVDTQNVEPLVSPTPIVQFLREDDITDELGAEKAVGNAPERQGNLFKVPPVVGD